MRLWIFFPFSRLYVENKTNLINTCVPRKGLLKIFSGLIEMIIDQVLIRTSLWRRYSSVRESSAWNRPMSWLENQQEPGKLTIFLVRLHILGFYLILLILILSFNMKKKKNWYQNVTMLGYKFHFLHSFLICDIILKWYTYKYICKYRCMYTHTHNTIKIPCKI